MLEAATPVIKEMIIKEGMQFKENKTFNLEENFTLKISINETLLLFELDKLKINKNQTLPQKKIIKYI